LFFDNNSKTRNQIFVENESLSDNILFGMRQSINTGDNFIVENKICSVDHKKIHKFDFHLILIITHNTQ